MKQVNAKQLKKILNITGQTLYNWRKANKIVFKKLNSKNFIYDIDSVINQGVENEKEFVSYCRVSNTKQKDDLLRQEQAIINYAAANGIIINSFYKEIASGMNEERKVFNKLIDDVISGKVVKIFITYKDRLTRFGFSYFEKLFKRFGCEIVTINATNETTFEQELTQDLISIIHHFSMKMYSNRRSKLKQIVEELENENN